MGPKSMQAPQGRRYVAAPLNAERGHCLELLGVRPIRGVYIVHILGVGSGRMWVGSGRTPHDSAGTQ